MSFPIPLRDTSRQPHSQVRPHTHHGQEQPSSTWSRRTGSLIKSPHRRTSSASLKLVPLINKFEDLDAVSLDLPRPDLQPAPLQISRKRPRAEDPNRLSTIFSPEVRSHEEVLTDPFSPTEATAATTASSTHNSESTKMGLSRHRAVDNEACRLVTSDLLSESRMLGAPSTVPSKDTAGKRVDSISFKDKIKLFDKTVRSVGNNVKEPPLSVAPNIPATPKKQVTKGSPVPRSTERTKPVHVSPITPTKTRGSALKKPNLMFGTASSPYNFPTTMKPQPSITTPMAKYSTSPPKVKLSNIYTDNSHLPARGRVILRKDTTVPDQDSERKWSTAKPLSSPSKPSSSPHKNNCRGNSIVSVGSEHQPIHTRRRNISNKIHTMYRTKSQRNSPIQIGIMDGHESRHASKIGVPEKDDMITKPGGKIGVKIAALKRLFDGGSQSKAPDPASKSSSVRSSRVVRGSEGDLLVQPPGPQDVATGFLKTTNTKQMEAQDSTPKKITARLTTQAPVATGRAPMTEQPQRSKTKIGDKIKLFESFSKSKEKIERRFKGSGSSSTKTTRGGNLFRRESRGLTYSELKEVAGEFSSVDNSDGAKEGKRKSLVGMWNDLKSGRGGSNKTIEERELIIKEVQCGLREPKPLRLTEMNKVMALCKDLGERVASGGNGGGGSKKSIDQEKSSCDALRAPP